MMTEYVKNEAMTDIAKIVMTILAELTNDQPRVAATICIGAAGALLASMEPEERENTRKLLHSFLDDAIDGINKVKRDAQHG